MSDNDQTPSSQPSSENASGGAQMPVEGTAIRSTNGRLYFIPKDALTAYEITDDSLEHALKDLSHNLPSLTDVADTLSKNLHEPVDPRRVQVGIAISWAHNIHSET